ncbi:MAG: Ig-like domain-containing protein, partial [Erysipelotrichaceae bacterium]|nr:Ig-like domain-containing protein [Erysipelotrichaceae bacterium]
NIEPTFKWKSKGNAISDAYFKVSFKSVEDIGLSEGQYQHYYGDFSQIDGSDFLNSLSHVFQEKKAGVKTIIPICTIKVPLPHAPVVKLVMQLVVKIGATGRIELGLVNEHLVGLEIRNGQLRTFHEHGHDLDFIIKATAESGLGTLIGMEAMNYRLADMRVDAGISTTVKTMAHLYDDQGEKVSVGSELPLSVVDVLSVGKEEVKFCGDLSGNWTLDLVFNDSDSLASKAGFYKEFEVFSEDNAPLFKNSQLHLEDGLFVDKCTRSNKNKSLITELPITYKIQLQDYAFSLKKGESKNIVIKGLPKDVLLKDLRFSSLDAGVASVTSSGVVTGVESGNTVILIGSRDGKYETQCSVMVKWDDTTGNS